MIANYLNQSLTWKHVSSVDAYNQPTYTTTTITGRMESKRKMLTGVNGQVVITGSVVFTQSAVEVNDLIDDHLVLVVDTIRDFKGDVNHYEVLLQ